MTSPVFVVGHRNPDADSICAAVAGAELFRRRDGLDTLAARAGDLRPEAAYILARFGVEPPVLLADLRTRVADVMSTPAVTVRVDDPLLEAGRRLQDRGVLALPVVDDDERLCGIVETAAFAQLFLRGLDPATADRIPYDLKNIVRVLNGHELVDAPERHLTGKMRVGAMAVETMRARIEPDILMVIGDREDAQLAAIERGIGALVVTGDNPVSERVRDLARQRHVTVISVPHHTYATVRLIAMSAPVREIVRSNVPSCSPDGLVDEVKDRLRSERMLPVVDGEHRVVGVVTRTDLLRSVRRQVVLVDHNERGQAVDGIEDAEIIGIVDHHRIADVQTRMPPFVRVEPVGSTNTILARLFGEAGLTITPQLAGVMLGGILADTLGFRSSTTTATDRQIAGQLAPTAGVDLVSFGNEILAAASNVTTRSAEELLMQDFKQFTLGGLRFGIGVIETTDSKAVLARRKELLKAMEQLRQQGYASILLAVVDVERQVTPLLVAGHVREVAETFGVQPVGQHLIELPGIVSRKKQVVPLLNRLHDAIVEP